MSDINIGAISEALNNKVDLPSPTIPQDAVDYVIEMQRPTANNNYTWYRKYKSGWVEQGGWVEGGENIASNVVFPVPMTNIYYALSFGGTKNTNPTSGSTPSYRGIYRDTGTVSARSTTGFTLGNGEQISWNVCGYAAQ